MAAEEGDGMNVWEEEKKEKERMEAEEGGRGGEREECVQIGQMAASQMSAEAQAEMARAIEGLGSFLRPRAHNMLAFLERIMLEFRWIGDAHTTRWSRLRYFRFLLLLKDHPTLIPPMDVAMHWLAHSIRRWQFEAQVQILLEVLSTATATATSDLLEDCARIVDVEWNSPSIASQQQLEESRLIWERDPCKVVDVLMANERIVRGALDLDPDLVTRMPSREALLMYRWVPSNDEEEGVVSAAVTLKSSVPLLGSLLAKRYSARLHSFDSLRPSAVLSLSALLTGPHHAPQEMLVTSFSNHISASALTLAFYASPIPAPHHHNPQMVKLEFDNSHDRFLWAHRLASFNPAAYQRDLRWPRRIVKDVEWLFTLLNSFYFPRDLFPPPPGAPALPLFSGEESPPLSRFYATCLSSYASWASTIALPSNRRATYGPPVHIDLFWHAHLSSPKRYAEFFSHFLSFVPWHEPQSDQSCRRTGCCICF